MVPLNCSCAHALLLGRHHVAGQDRQHRAVHRHGHAHLVQRDAVEQDLHVLDRVDGHAGLADVAGDARMVAVVAAVRGQVEGHADALPAGGQRLAVEGIAFLGGGEARVLADGPRPHRVHRGLRAAHEGRESGQRVGVRQALQVGRGVQRLDVDALGRDPVQRRQLAARRRLGGGLGPGFECGVGLFDGSGHEGSPVAATGRGGMSSMRSWRSAQVSRKSRSLRRRHSGPQAPRRPCRQSSRDAVLSIIMNAKPSSA